MTAGLETYQVWRTYHTKPTEGPYKGQWVSSGALCPASQPVSGLGEAELQEVLEQAQTDFAHQQKTTGEPDAHFEMRVIWPVTPDQWPD